MPLLFGTPCAFLTLPRLWLAAREGAILPPPGGISAAPELPMLVRFEGLTPDEERRALRAFPGGRRFLLLDEPGR